MSQRNVERIIGNLVTDEANRIRFEENPHTALKSFAESGLEITPDEFQALATINPDLLFGFSIAIDSRLQRVAPQGGVS